MLAWQMTWKKKYFSFFLSSRLFSLLPLHPLPFSLISYLLLSLFYLHYQIFQIFFFSLLKQPQWKTSINETIDKLCQTPSSIKTASKLWANDQSSNSIFPWKNWRTIDETIDKVKLDASINSKVVLMAYITMHLSVLWPPSSLPMGISFSALYKCLSISRRCHKMVAIVSSRLKCHFGPCTLKFVQF